MKVLHTQSLGATVDAIAQAHFFGKVIPHPERARAAKWIASRQGMPGAYRGDFFAPTELDFANGFYFFTGEHIGTRAGTSHIIGEEACRALTLLGINTLEVREALNRADGVVDKFLACHEDAGYKAGMYCCGKCSVALWRNLLVRGTGKAERRLAAGMKALKEMRDGKGKWGRFPFYYTLLALGEMDIALALAEMRYAAPACERALKAARRTAFAARQQAVLERVLAKV